MKKCKNCKAEFVQYSTIQNLCTACLIIKGRKIAEKNAKKAIQTKKKQLRADKEAIKPLKYWADKAQVAINKWIVHGRDKDLPCISCGTTNPNIQYCASHYRSRKAASQLRYNEDNLHKACNHYCNMQLSGNIENYRPALIKKIGQERHDALINNNEVKRWTIEECKAIEAEYKLKLKEINES